MELADAIRARRSHKSFDADRPVDDGTLKRIFDVVRWTPSSFNLQHWRFVVVRSPARRGAICEAAYGQRHVGEAPAVVVVCAKLRAHEDGARVNGHAPSEVLAGLVPIIDRYYAEAPQFQRDEAIRSASLAAMNLMLLAEAEGLVTCPMIGFRPDEVARIVGLDEGHFPVMLVCLGRKGPADPFPTSRLPLDETVTLETLDGKGLA